MMKGGLVFIFSNCDSTSVYVYSEEFGCCIGYYDKINYTLVPIINVPKEDAERYVKYNKVCADFNHYLYKHHFVTLNNIIWMSDFAKRDKRPYNQKLTTIQMALENKRIRISLPDGKFRTIELKPDLHVVLYGIDRILKSVGYEVDDDYTIYIIDKILKLLRVYARFMFIEKLNGYQKKSIYPEVNKEIAILKRNMLHRSQIGCQCYIERYEDLPYWHELNPGKRLVL